MKVRLLPNKFKKWGWISGFIGVVFACINLFTTLRIESPVFAIYSGFVKEKYLQISHSNLTDELSMIFILSGLLVLIFSEESDENERTKQVRLSSLLFSFLLNYLLFIISVTFIYGSGFMVFVILNLCSQSIFYLICFAILNKKLKIL